MLDPGETAEMSTSGGVPIPIHRDSMGVAIPEILPAAAGSDKQSIEKQGLEYRWRIRAPTL